MNIEQKWFAIVNPNSANGRTGYKWPKFYEQLIRNNINIDFKFTTEQGNGSDLCRKAIAEGYNRIIAVGGDGTVNEVVNGLIVDNKLVNEQVELAIWGQGTGCDFVRIFGSGKDVRSFADVLRSEKKSKVDIGKVIYHNKSNKINHRYFINVANLGLGAEVVNRVNNKSKLWGSRLTYFLGTIATILKFKSFEAKILLDNSLTIDDTFWGLMICNGQYIGGGMRIAPEARVNDGLFDLVTLRDIPKLKVFSRFSDIYVGKHVDVSEISFFKCQNVLITTPFPTLLEVDGEVLSSCTQIEFQIIPQLLTLRS